MDLFVSTSRKPSQHTRTLARQLAHALRATYDNRGKRSLSEVAAIAEQKGLTRLMIVYEKHGNPHSLNFLADGEWLNPVVLIGRVELRERGRVKLPRDVSFKAKDEDGERLAKLFGFEKAETSDAVTCMLSRKSIEFEYDGVKVGPVVEIRNLIDEEASGTE
ncbi:MAG: hypothetical protein V1834_03140 [Candidatus Micrarchaeota archaeon]